MPWKAAERIRILVKDMCRKGGQIEKREDNKEPNTNRTEEIPGYTVCVKEREREREIFLSNDQSSG